MWFCSDCKRYKIRQEVVLWDCEYEVLPTYNAVVYFRECTVLSSLFLLLLTMRSASILGQKIPRKRVIHMSVQSNHDDAASVLNLD